MTPQMSSTILQFAPLVLIFGVFYWLILRPQQQKQKQLRAKLAALKRGDRVVTAGGLLGTVAKAREGATEIEIDIAPTTRVTVLRDTLSAVLAPEAAND
jgi:preprotein translocase subunit YajC